MATWVNYLGLSCHSIDSLNKICVDELNWRNVQTCLDGFYGLEMMDVSFPQGSFRTWRHSHHIQTCWLRGGYHANGRWFKRRANLGSWLTKTDTLICSCMIFPQIYIYIYIYISCLVFFQLFGADIWWQQIQETHPWSLPARPWKMVGKEDDPFPLGFGNFSGSNCYPPWN